jgi:hypothetical protein
LDVYVPIEVLFCDVTMFLLLIPLLLLHQVSADCSTSWTTEEVALLTFHADPYLCTTTPPISVYAAWNTGCVVAPIDLWGAGTYMKLSCVSPTVAVVALYSTTGCTSIPVHASTISEPFEGCNHLTSDIMVSIATSDASTDVATIVATTPDCATTVLSVANQTAGACIAISNAGDNYFPAISYNCTSGVLTAYTAVDCVHPTGSYAIAAGSVCGGGGSVYGDAVYAITCNQPTATPTPATSNQPTTTTPTPTAATTTTTTIGPHTANAAHGRFGVFLFVVCLSISVALLGFAWIY